MASFFEKLKRGMNIEEPITDFKEEGEEETTNETKIIKKPKRSPKQSLLDATGQAKIKKSPKEDKIAEIKIKKIEIQTKMPEEKIEEKTIEEMEIENQAEKDLPEEPEEEKEKKWSSFGKTEEGQLAIDVYQTEDDLVIQSAIAGVKPENLDISMERDIITIKGSREKPFKEDGDYFAQECFWGFFSREMIMPVEVDPQRAVAEMKNGILTIRIPKILREKKRKIIIRE